jgi:hypothetical protein
MRNSDAVLDAVRVAGFSKVPGDSDGSGHSKRLRGVGVEENR